MKVFYILTKFLNLPRTFLYIRFLLFIFFDEIRMYGNTRHCRRKGDIHPLRGKWVQWKSLLVDQLTTDEGHRRARSCPGRTVSREYLPIILYTAVSE